MLTDVELRTRWGRGGKVCHVEPGTILTPAAQDFVRERGIRICESCPVEAYETMTVTSVPVENGKIRYRDALTGRETEQKGEMMTHLHGNLLVPKTHPRIAFRGRLDALMAGVLRVQLAAVEEEKNGMAGDLQELLDCLRRILAAEVKEEPLEPLKLLGMDSAQIRRVSHNVREYMGIDHPVPDHRMGRLCVELNLLRTQVREVELTAAAVFSDETGDCRRQDIVEILNRLSSCVYILFCRELTGYYRRGAENELL